jgi:hypothetical protein
VKGVPYGIGLGWSLISGVLALHSINEYWPLLSLFPALPTFFFYLWVIRRAKRCVVQELSGNPVSLSAFERARSWNTA